MKNVVLHRNEEDAPKPSSDARSKQTLPSEKIRQIPITTVQTDRWPPGVDVDETDISWSSDMPQPPEEVLLPITKPNVDGKNLECKRQIEKSGSVNWSELIEQRYLLHLILYCSHMLAESLIATKKDVGVILGMIIRVSRVGEV